VRRTVVVVVLLVVALSGGAEPLGAAAKRPFAGKTLDGKRLSLATLRGKPVLINVWSSW
jgi:cytochrome oxidase Cu insertion factor (SCO1/SenC/PrrC family)